MAAEPRFDDQAIARHREAVLRHIDVDAVRSARFHVAVDCCNGAAYAATPEFLSELGCRVTAIHTDPDAPFPHDPEPIPENMTDLCAAVRTTGADIGFIQDADADRLAIADQTGMPLGEEATLAIVVRHVLKRDPGPVVVNVSTSRMLDDVCREAGCPLHRTRVGEINVVSRMMELRSRIGGEGNGGVIAPDINPCRDSFVAMAYVLEAMAIAGKSVSELSDAIPRYAFIKERVEVRPRDVPALLRALRGIWADAELDLTDGIKALWPDRWIQARASNTEPIIRLIAEAPEETEARLMLDHARAILMRSV